MSAVFLKTPPKAIATASDESKLHGVLTTQGALGCCNALGVELMASAGLSWFQIIQLVWKYGPLITTIANEVITALKSSGGLTLALISNLISHYGAQVEQMIKDLLATLGLSLPT